MQWYYANGGQRVGPVSAEDFEAAVRADVVHADTLVWTQGMPEWQRWSEAEARFGGVPPVLAGSPAPIAAAPTVEYAGFWVRFVAKLLDSLLLWVVNTVLNVILAIACFGGLAAIGGRGEGFLAFQLASIAANLVTGLLYMVIFVRLYSATPGKMALGLKLVRSDGSRLTVGRIIGRFFAEMLSGLILAIGYIMAAFDDEKRALHDRLCDTRVIKSP